MEKKIFSLLGVGFSDLRQIALTFCHRIFIVPESKNSGPIRSAYRSFGPYE